MPVWFPVPKMQARGSNYSFKGNRNLCIFVPLTRALGPYIRFVVSSLDTQYEAHRVGMSRRQGKMDYARVSGHVASPRSVPGHAPLPPRPTSIA